jgi:signal transduction histidine kinase
MGVDRKFVNVTALPPDVHGVPVQYDAIGTVEQALKWHPNTSRLVVVTGASPEDREWEALLRRDLPRFSGRLNTTEFIAGLPTADVRTRVSGLGKDSIIFTPGYFRDGEGQTFAPREAARVIAAASPVPVYGPYNTFIGSGVVGGRVPTFLSMGQMAGGIVNQLLADPNAALPKLPDVMPTTLSVDWREVERWGIDPKEVPNDTVVQFRTPSFWDLYRVPALTALAVILLQTALLTGLLLERRRRRKAEVSVDKHRFELAHASRLAIAGELTASIAHEINQPLGAIQSNVAAASLILESGSTPEDLRQILDDIRRDNMRASDVVRQLRRLLEKHEIERRVVNLNDALVDMQTILRAEAQRRRVAFDIRQQSPDVDIVGDRIQVQQVLINLVLNAMDAVADEPEGRRTVSVSVSKTADIAFLNVNDTGHGIPSDHLDRLFESFFSTKPRGIGLGLSIVRTLVETHGGKVRAENRSSGGATFQVEFPLAIVKPMEAVA